MDRKSSASMEDYLESILLLRQEKGTVRVSQISRALGVKMPSVTSALRKLSRQGLVEHKRYGGVQLTAGGEKIAWDVLRRHEALCHFLVDILDVDPEVAAADACKMEHAVSPLTQDKLSRFIKLALTRRKA